MSDKAHEPRSVPGNAYFFTGRRLDGFDFDEGGGGESATGGGGLTTGSESLTTGDMSFWLCFYSSASGSENPLDFDGDGTIDDADLAWFEACVADAGGSTEGATTESTLSEPLAGESAMASSTPGLVLYHYRARAQDPNLGRFMQRDTNGLVGGTSKVELVHSSGPILAGALDPAKQHTDGMNLYQYGQSDPLLYVDPSGFATPACIACASCFAALTISCACICADGTGWDNPSDSFITCVLKCGRDAPTWIQVACSVACIGCKITVPPKKPPKPIPGPPIVPPIE